MITHVGQPKYAPGTRVRVTLPDGSVGRGRVIRNTAIANRDTHQEPMTIRGYTTTVHRDDGALHILNQNRILGRDYSTPDEA